MHSEIMDRLTKHLKNDSTFDAIYTMPDWPRNTIYVYLLGADHEKHYYERLLNIDEAVYYEFCRDVREVFIDIRFVAHQDRPYDDCVPLGAENV